MNRLFKEGIVTTIIGLVVILIGVIVWTFTEAPASEVAIICGIGSGLLFLKDKNIGIKK